MAPPMKISLGLNLPKKAGTANRNALPKRKAIFGGGEDDGEDGFGLVGGAAGPKKASDGPIVENITELGEDFLSGSAAHANDADKSDDRRGRKKESTPALKESTRNRLGSPSSQPPPPPAISLSSRRKRFDDGAGQFDVDLSTALTARKYAAEAEALDPSVYDYDASYDAFKAAAASRRKAGEEADDEEGRPKPQYMSNIRKMAEVRERDRRIAEDKKMQRERAAEGEDFADKEKFVTEAYKQQQVENRRLEEEERRREEAEAARAAATGVGMTGFYKQLLARDEERQSAIQQAVESQRAGKPAKVGAAAGGDGVSGSGSGSDAHLDTSAAAVEEDIERASAARAREINARGGAVAVNEDGEVVDKRQLLRGGLNISARKQAELRQQQEARRKRQAADSRDGHSGAGGTGSGNGNGNGNGRGSFAGAHSKQAMRDRQSRMLEAQYEQVLKRSLEEEEEQIKAAQEAAKTRKTTADISSAKERYLARKRAEAEAKAAAAAKGG